MLGNVLKPETILKISVANRITYNLKKVKESMEKGIIHQAAVLSSHEKSEQF